MALVAELADAFCPLLRRRSGGVGSRDDATSTVIAVIILIPGSVSKRGKKLSL